MASSSTTKATPEKYQAYAAYWQQRKAEKRSRLKQRHQAGLATARDLADILKKDFGATKVALFGSMLSINNIRMRSDIDLAVWDLPSLKYISALTRLMNCSGSFDVDLVRIEEAPPSLRKCILDEGLILDKDVPQSDEFIGDDAMPKYNALIRRIRQSLSDIDREYSYAHEQAMLAKETKQDIYWTAVGLSLHGFYTGIEKAFERIVDNVDGGLISSKSGQWHKDLLDQVLLDVPGTRPAVIDQRTREYLDEYLSFRHVIRNNYTHRLDPEKIAVNYEMLEDCYQLLTQQLSDFCDFLASVG
ncbi:MAG: nucleotidyltransferase domain-containing protein [Cyanobacteria bacterium J06581_3]